MMAEMVADTFRWPGRHSSAPTPAPRRKLPAPATVGVRPSATGPAPTVVRKQTESHRIRPDNEEEEEGGKAKLALIIGASVGALVLVVFAFLHIQKEMGVASFRNRMNALAVEKPEGTTKDIPCSVQFLSTDPKRSDERALGILSSIQGPGIEEAIVAELKSAEPGPIRIGVMRALAKRGTTAAFDPVLEIYRSAEGEERSVAGQTLQDIAKPGQEPTLLGLSEGQYSQPDESGERGDQSAPSKQRRGRKMRPGPEGA